MKAMFKVFGSVIGLGLVILVVFHLVMLYGLTQAMREVVLPKLKEDTGIDARVGRLSINVAEGKMFLDEISILNPEGFFLENLASVGRIEVEVDVKTLIRQKPLIVKNVVVEGALVNVIRNKDGELNFSKLQERLPPPAPGEPAPVPEPGKQPPEKAPVPETPQPEQPSEPLPELLFKRILCNASVRYLDFQLDELDITLDLNVKAAGLSTLSSADAKWGAVAVTGALRDNHNSYVTDLNLRLAPVRDPEVWSFDLTGRIMEIDPRSLESLYKRAGIRTAPFGIEPQFYCRENRFTKSHVRISLADIQLEDKLSRKLGHMGAIDKLEFSAPVKGTLYEPEVDLLKAMMSAIGANTSSLLDALIRGQLEKQSKDGNEVTKKVLKDLAEGGSSATNQPAPITSDTIVDILGEQIDEIGENEELQKELKDLGKWLFGK